MDGTTCNIVLNMEGSKPFMFKIFYLNYPSFFLPKFLSKQEIILVGNGQYVGALFVIPAATNLHGHRFEVYRLVSEIHDNVDMVLGIKIVFEKQ